MQAVLTCPPRAPTVLVRGQGCAAGRLAGSGRVCQPHADSALSSGLSGWLRPLPQVALLAGKAQNLHRLLGPRGMNGSSWK